MAGEELGYKLECEYLGTMLQGPGDVETDMASMIWRYGFA